MVQSNEVQWVVGHQAWSDFTNKHPELGYKQGRMNFHNFLRLYKYELQEYDVIRKAKNKYWIASIPGFRQVAFDLATGVQTLGSYSRIREAC